jgi:hypothetical protein
MQSIRTTVCAVRPLFAAVGLFSACSTALAGPVWDIDLEDDAKQTASDAQIITTLHTTTSIIGRLGGFGLVGADFVDMYQVTITAQTLLSISTAGGALGGNASFDSQLFVFKRKGGNGNNVRALGLKANNDAAIGNFGSRIGEELDPSSDYTLLSPGTYYIAIAGVGTNPVDEFGNLIWSDLGAAGLTTSGNETSLGDWAGQGAVGEYTIRLQMSSNFVPAPGALAVLACAGLVGRRRR